MTYQEYLKAMEIAENFYDTIDFKKFMDEEFEVNVRGLMDRLEDYYENKHPELIPEEMQGYFFNFHNTEEFCCYLVKRYGSSSVREEEIVNYYIRL